MAQMRDFEAEAARVVDHLFHHAAPAAPSFTPASSSQPEVHPMSLGSQLHRYAAVIEAFGEDGIAVFEAIAANPEARDLVIVAARLAGLPLTPGTINAALGGLQAIEATWHAAQQGMAQQQAGTGSQPAQPQAARQTQVV